MDEFFWFVDAAILLFFPVSKTLDGDFYDFIKNKQTF